GTPDGYLALTDTGSLLFMNQFEVEAFAANFGSLVFQVPADQSASVVYASDTGAFALSSIGDGGGVVVAGPADIVAPAVESCPGAPPLRLQVGSSARVSFTNGIPLRVRATPGGQIITQIAEGTAFTVIGGPQCQGNYAWWQIRTSGGTEGWSAEGDVNSYFIEPVQPRSQADVIVSLPTATPTPQLMIAVLPTATPGLVIAAPEDICNLAPTTRLQPQMQARTNTPGGTLAMRFSPTDEFPSNQIPHNSVVSVQGQSRCREGYRIWPVAVTLDGQIVTGWVSEGTQQQYFLDPLP
ncbi:MAG TPA: SH3 domain-containing protein, partial [Spirillospora sp.]|nr:SH3 domain-containing protein [Spirillospora sp.]